MQNDPNQPPYQQPYYPPQQPPREPGIATGFKLMLGAILALVVLAGGACVACAMLYGGMAGYYSRNSNSSSIYSPPTSTPTPAPKEKVISLAQFNQLKDGMSYTEAVRILGKEGKENYSSGSGRSTSKIYSWDGGNSGSVTLTFMNDKLYSKSQFGLE